MKLVDILARELKVWPNDEYESIGQANDGALHKSPNWDAGCGWSKEKYTMAEDWSRVHVTRAQWQAAVDALKAEKVVIPSDEAIEAWLDGLVVSYGLDAAQTCREIINDARRKKVEAEQIAAKFRQRAINQICIDAGSQEMTPGQLNVAARLYDAGYRKFEIVDN